MHPLSRRTQGIGLVAWLVLGFAVAAVGGIGSIHAGVFYADLARPAWAPPASVFGPVWTILYAMMSVAAWLVWRIGGFRAAPAALTLFLAQLAVNALWSWLFFRWRLGAWAFVDILLLWALIAATLTAFRRHSWPAVALLIPYLLWVTFASALNYVIWQLNPQAL